MKCPRHFRCFDFVRRFLAVAGVFLVLALGVLAQDAALHRQIHDATATAAADDGCVIDLFAHGVAMTGILLAKAPVTVEWGTDRPVVVSEVLLTAPHHLVPPERGPPFC